MQKGNAMDNKELIKIREDRKLSKGEFAALLGITAMMQGRYESGKIKIPDHIAEEVLALAAVKAVKENAGKTTDKKSDKAMKDKTGDAVKTAVKTVAKAKTKEAVRKVEKKAVKGAVKTAAGAAAVKEVKKTSKDKKEKAPKAGRKKEPVLIIESLMGGTITTEEILSRVPAGIDEVYIKPEENKAYWVKGKKTGDVDLW